MGTIYNTELHFSDYVLFAYSTTGGFRPCFSWDSIVLYGSGVTLGDQQHENNRGVNYLSYRVKYIRLLGDVGLATNADDDDPDIGRDMKLTVVLYKVPVKYETGVVVPCATTHNFTTLKDYILYSNPRSVLSWKVFSNFRSRQNTQYGDPIQQYTFDVEMECFKKFVVGPYDVLCLNVLLDFGVASINVDGAAENKPVVLSKIL